MNSNRGRVGTSTGKVSFSFGGIGAYLDRGREGVHTREITTNAPLYRSPQEMAKG
jgi:hypothetical protein